ncbi:MAG: phosphomannose isomerase type II C-terminal cupin domain [Thermoanaerobaculia bacterium]
MVEAGHGDLEGLDDRRPWGGYRILDEAADHKVKRIVVLPGQRLSLQRHRRRGEHWYVVRGEALVERDGEQIRLAAGEAVDIPLSSWHRVANPGEAVLVFIEVQRGDYFGEDDIERAQDDYGRA